MPFGKRFDVKAFVNYAIWEATEPIYELFSSVRRAADVSFSV